ncbi:MAG: D-alanyl-D-alanine carboxypeptidase/D-alanyl-D-alanine-endopeptidase [Armatimonadaceae bacterium]
MKYLSALTFLSIAVAFPLPAALAQTATVAAKTVPAPTLTARLEATLDVPVLRNAIVGALVRDAETGETLFARNPQFALMPASNQKILTAAATLGLLGSDFRYATILFRTGTVGADGALSGDLYLKGSGDPSLLSADLRELAKALKGSGVREFRGRIFADDSRFPGPALGEGWQWDDEPFYYQPQISALSCDGNALLFTVQPGNTPGAPATVLVGEPSLPTVYVPVVNRARTATAGVAESVRVERLRSGNAVVVTGEVSLGSKPITAVRTVEDPAQYAAYRLYEMLKVEGIAVGEAKVARGTVPPDAVAAATHRSKPLSALVADFLKPSDNLFGECFLRTLGAERGSAGTDSEGAKAVREFLKSAGIPTDGLYIADGSGLSRMNNITPQILTAILLHADRKFSPETKKAFYDGLPVAGLDGTMRNRLKGTAAERNVHAKTGTLGGVSALSGYVTTKSGKRLVFSLLMNHFASAGSASQARAAQDAFVTALANLTP